VSLLMLFLLHQILRMTLRKEEYPATRQGGA
jgi:hypothetical protein